MFAHSVGHLVVQWTRGMTYAQALLKGTEGQRGLHHQGHLDHRICKSAGLWERQGDSNGQSQLRVQVTAKRFPHALQVRVSG